MMIDTAVEKVGRVAVDILLGLAVFYFLAGFLVADGGARAAARSAADAAGYASGDTTDMARAAVAGLPGPADSHAFTFLAGPTEPSPIFRQTSQQAAMGVLAVVFSFLFTLNLAFWRHLRRAYVRRR